MNGEQTEGEMEFTSHHKCEWHERTINSSKAGKAHSYSAYCKPVIRDKPGE